MECDYQDPEIKITHVDNVVIKMISKHEPTPIFREVVVMDLGDYIPEIEMNYN